MSPTSSIAQSSVAAGAWFLDSGIQEPNGGVARYYRADLARNERVSNEITGYSISAYCWLYQRSGDSRYLHAARRAATLLVDRAWLSSPGIWPFEYPADTRETARAYFFDTGIISPGSAGPLAGHWRVKVARCRCRWRQVVEFISLDHESQRLPSRSATPVDGTPPLVRPMVTITGMLSAEICHGVA